MTMHTATTPPLGALVLGIGNLLWADEGFGVRCAEKLAAEWETPTGVEVMDGGTQGLYLLPYVQAAQRLLVFDAIDWGLPPGQMKLMRDDEAPRFMGAKKMSLHQTGFQEVLAAAALTGQAPRSLLLIGVQPLYLDDYGGSLSAPVKARLDEAVALAAAQLGQWGLPLRRRNAAAAANINDAALAINAYESGRPAAAVASRIGDARFFPEA